MEWWGAERVVSNLVKEYIQSGKDVYFFTLKDKLFYDIPKEVHYIPLSKIKNNLLLFLLIPRFSIKFRRILKTYKLDDWI